MRSRTVRILAVLVVVLFGVLYALSTTKHDTVGTASELLAPDLKARLNDVSSISITDSKGELTIERAENDWRVQEKAGYPANTATLGQVLRALADARKIEQKTANPSLYDKLGVQNPADGGDGVLVTGKGPDFSFSVIVGKTAPGDFRYARIPDEAQSWLIDKDPKLPDAPGGWLESDIVDIAPAAVQTVEIHHADGETIRLHKDSADATTFDVGEIPKGRELSYPTVANGIAGALGNLTLDDVAKAGKDEMADPVNVRYETFDGLRVDVVAGRLGENTWLTLHASAEPGKTPTPTQAEAATDANKPAEEPKAADATAASDGDQAPQGSDEPAASEAGAKADDKPASGPTPEEKAASINERTAGWRYQVASYKADQLTRRWEDLLKAKDEDK